MEGQKREGAERAPNAYCIECQEEEAAAVAKT